MVKFPLLYIQQNANVKYKFVFGIKTGVSNRWTNIEYCISFVPHAQIQINCPPSADKSAFFGRKAKNAAKKHFKNYLLVGSVVGKYSGIGTKGRKADSHGCGSDGRLPENAQR